MPIPSTSPTDVPALLQNQKSSCSCELVHRYLFIFELFVDLIGHYFIKQLNSGHDLDSADFTSPITSVTNTIGCYCVISSHCCPVFFVTLLYFATLLVSVSQYYFGLIEFRFNCSGSVFATYWITRVTIASSSVSVLKPADLRHSFYQIK